MIELNPMTAAEYEAFMELSSADHIRGQVEAGYWKEEQGEAKMQQMVERFLPEGAATPGHNFFMVRDPETEDEVGALWYWVTEKDGHQLIFVMDIQVYPEFKRQGYGSQAFLEMEAQARELGIKLIALNVFEHNTAARAMYEKLGYLGEGESLFKQLVD